MSRPGMVCSLVMSLAALACRGGQRASSWTGTVDTTANGTIVVHNGKTGVWDWASAWRLEEAARIGSTEGGGPGSFSNVRGIEVDALGRIYVLENSPQEIRVFDSGGAYVRTIGRQGSGPGEFTEAIGMTWDTAGLLWVVDQRNTRYTAFDSSGRRVTDHPRPVTGFFTWRWSGGIGLDGWWYDLTGVPGPEFRTVLVRLDDRFMATDTLPLPQFQPPVYRIERTSMRMYYSVPFAPSLAWIFDPRGFVWFAVTDRYRVYQLRLDGDTVLILEREVEPERVTEAEKDSALASEMYQRFRSQGGTTDRSRIPDTRPPVLDFVPDDAGNLWVRVTREPGTTGTAFDVFDPSGRYLGQVTTPLHVSLPLVRGGNLYAVAPDDDGVPYVVRLRIRNRH